MSRFSDLDTYDDLESLLAWGRWEGRRKAVLNGKPGKAALADLHRALLAMPHKRLIEGTLCDGTGVCAMGAWIYRHRVGEGMSPRDAWTAMKKGRPHFDKEYDLELDDTIEAGVKVLGITRTLAELVAYENDEGSPWATPEERYERVLRWVERHMATDVARVNRREG